MHSRAWHIMLKIQVIMLCSKKLIIMLPVVTYQGRRNRSGWSGGRRTNILPKRTSLFNQKALVPAIARTPFVIKYNECKH